MAKNIGALVVGNQAVATQPKGADASAYKANQWKPGQSGNPSGRPKGLRELEQAILERHGPNVTVALQALFEMGMDPEQPGKVRVPALNAFVNHVKGTPRAQRDEESPADGDAGLMERVVGALVRRAPELVAAQLKALPGGKL